MNKADKNETETATDAKMTKAKDPATGGSGSGSGSDAKNGAKNGERIAKVLARAGLCSRRDAERWIAEGRVAVEGKVLDSPAFTVEPGAMILVDGKPLPEKAPTRLWRYHKPSGLVSSHRDEKGRATLFDELPPELGRVISVGRLDLNSEGLLLLTNDGELARRLELPATGWIRRYRVRVHGTVDLIRLQALEKGLTIDGVRYGSIKVEFDRQQGANAWLTVALSEGKNREVRRVFDHLGYSVNRLLRIAYGPFQLGLLPKGAVEEVPRRVLRDQLNFDPGARPRKAGAAPEAEDAPVEAVPARRKPPKPHRAGESDKPARFGGEGSGKGGGAGRPVLRLAAAKPGAKTLGRARYGKDDDAAPKRAPARRSESEGGGEERRSARPVTPRTREGQGEFRTPRAAVKPAGDAPKREPGERPSGERKPAGNRFGGDKASGNKTAGNRAAGERTVGDRPSGGKPFGNKGPRGNAHRRG